MRAVLLVAFLGLSAPVHAVPITYDFAGSITYAGIDPTIRDAFVPGIELGAGFYGSLTFDIEEAADRVFISLNVGGNQLATEVGSRLIIRNDAPEDSISARQAGPWQIGDYFPNLGYVRGETMHVLLKDVTGAALSADNLPTDLASVFPQRTLDFLGSGICEAQLCGIDRSFLFRLEGQIDTVAVPEPGTLLLLMSGLFAALLARPRRREVG